MKRKPRILIGALALVLIGAAGIGYYLLRNPSSWKGTLIQLDLAEPPAAGLSASGFIEAEEIQIAPQLGGRVADLLVEEGADVEAGTLLVQLDGTLLDAQIQSYMAGVEVAEAKLAQVRAGARLEQIRQAEARLDQATVARDGAQIAYQDALAIRGNPQELNAEITAARYAVRSAEAELAAAVAVKDAAVIAYDGYWDAKETFAERTEELRERFEDIPEHQRPPIPDEMPVQLDFHLIPYQYWKAWVGVNTAKAKLDQARTRLDGLLAMQNDPQELDAAVDAARTELEAAEALVQQAIAQLDALRSGATAEEIAIVEAQLGQARAALDRVLSQRDKLTITAPVGGMVLELTVREGELAAQGAAVLTLGDLDQVTLTVYIPEDQLGQVGVGQEAQVQVDSFPNQVFPGRIVAIANEAEFVPRNIQTREERVNMVFAVDISILNPEHKLKPGVPADAVLITQEGSHVSE